MAVGEGVVLITIVKLYKATLSTGLVKCDSVFQGVLCGANQDQRRPCLVFS